MRDKNWRHVPGEEQKDHTLDHSLSKSWKVKTRQQKKRSARTHLPFSSSLSSFLLFPLAALCFPLPFRFLSFSVCFLYLLPFSFRFFPALLGCGFCSFVSVLHPPQRCLRSCNSAYVCPLCAVLFLAFLFLIYFVYLLFPFFSISIRTSLVWCCLFLMALTLSTRFRFLLRLV